MVYLSNPREEFVNLVAQVNKMKGLGDLPSKILGELYIESGKLSLNEISERTGYSLSAISGAMKNLCNTGVVFRTKKLGSRKVYFHMEKGLIDNFLLSFKNINKNVINLMEEQVPEIIDSYEDMDSEEAEKEKKILENYYKELLILKDIFEDFINKLESIDIDKNG